MRELVTIQLGSYANFVGSHFWNFQDELLGLADCSYSDEIFRNHNFNMDVLYRTGKTRKGVPTYTPRLVSVDFQGSLGSVSSLGTLYNEVPNAPVDPLTWTGSLKTHASEPVKKNLFLQSLEENEKVSTSGAFDTSKGDSQNEVQDKDIVNCLECGVKYWTDFSKVHYHPKSLYEVSGSWMDVEDFNNYGLRRDLFSGSLHGEEINERLRFFVEECDHIQGIQFIVDDSGGFSGVAGEYLENIADEYTNVPVLLYSVRSPVSTGLKTRKQTISSNLHDAVSFSRLSTHSKLIVPLGLPSLSSSMIGNYLSVKDQKPYHTSAIYASAIHSISLPFRMEPIGPSAVSSYTCGGVNVNELVQILAGQGRQNKVAILDASLPALGYTGKEAILEHLYSLTPETAKDSEDLQAVEAMVVHGVFGSDSKRASISQVQDKVQAAYENAVGRPRFSHLSVSKCPLPIPLPFPSIFGTSVGQYGEILGTPIQGSSSTRGSLEVHSVPMAARLRSSNAVLPFLENKLENLRKFGIARGALGSELLRNWGFDQGELEDMGETLQNFVKCLKPDSEYSSDSD